ncbi:alpha/beta hydrolase [Schaalia suimastitidis]|uniref:alpha/beta hydrolase n=1 Tax=Schaalia suimastitidis TaxID=121163 RepID=UPI0003FF20C9|nr:alpha/beta hydrolase [Schaalia suimastitidis]
MLDRTTLTPPTRHGRRLAVLAAASAIAMGLAACSPATLIPGATSTTTSTPSSAANTALNAAWQHDNFRSFYDQQINWGTCNESHGLTKDLAAALDEAQIDYSAFECAKVKAPMNWADPSDTRTIELAINRIRATGDPQKAKPLFGNPGGPGVGGVQHTFSLIASPELDKVRHAYDLWGFDPRGVGASTPLKCEQDSDNAAVLIADCAGKHELSHYMGTSQVARDMELLRALSGSDRLHYLGYSYGTVLGATYATLFPEKAGRMVLDSAENAQWASLIHSFDQQVAVTKAVMELAKACPTTVLEDGQPVQCPFTNEEEVLTLKQSLDATPWKAGDGSTIDGRALRDYLTSSLYQPAIQATTLDNIGKAKAGSQEAIDAIATEIANGGASVDTVGQITLCHSSPKTPDVPALIEHMKKVGVPAFVGGPELSDDVLREFVNLDCSVLKEAGEDFTTAFDASKVETPLLVVGITKDHATPYQHAKTLTKELGKASLLTLEGDGHGASYSGKSRCVDTAVDDYLLNGTVPQEGTVCTQDAPSGAI